MILTLKLGVKKQKIAHSPIHLNESRSWGSLGGPRPWRSWHRLGGGLLIGLQRQRLMVTDSFYLYFYLCWGIIIMWTKSKLDDRIHRWVPLTFHCTFYACNQWDLRELLSVSQALQVAEGNVNKSRADHTFNIPSKIADQRNLCGLFSGLVGGWGNVKKSEPADLGRAEFNANGGVR